MRRGGCWLALLSAGVSGASFAADRIRPIGPEIVVVENETYVGSRQVVAGDDFGNFELVWRDRGARIHASDAVTLGSQLTDGSVIAGIAMHPSGTFVVSAKTQSGYGQDTETTFSGRLFSADGTPAGGEFQVQQFTGLDGYYAVPRVSMDATGSFVVVWQAHDLGESSGIFARRFAATGAALGDAFQVNAYVTGEQANPVVASAPGGHFVVAWEDDPPGGRYGISARAFDASGTPVAVEAVVNSSTAEYQFGPRIDADASGNFVVAWQIIDQRDYPDPGDHAVLARRLGPDGSPISDEMHIDTNQSDREFDLAVDPGGAFLIAWNDLDRIKARAFDRSGTPRGRAVQINGSTEGYQDDPTVASSGVGDFVVTWQAQLDYSGQINYRRARRMGPARVATKLRVKDDPDPAKRKIVLGPLGRVLTSGFGQRIDPVADGAFLHVYNASGAGDSTCIPLPAPGWTAKGPDPATAMRFVYADAEYANGPCASVTVANRKVVKAACKANHHPISFSLDEPQQGSVAVRLVSGARAYCSVFGAEPLVDKPGVFAASNGLPAGECPAAPAPCP